MTTIRAHLPYRRCLASAYDGNGFALHVLECGHSVVRRADSACQGDGKHHHHCDQCPHLPFLKDSLAARLAAARAAAGMTQQQVADAASMRLSVYQRLEQGSARKPQLATVVKLARALGVKLDKLAEGMT